MLSKTEQYNNSLTNPNFFPLPVTMYQPQIFMESKLPTIQKLKHFS
jgi:LEA14-like dessication related protein